MSGMIFISYRRGDDPGSTGRLFERLQTEGFPSDQLFMDIDSIAPGIDFVRELLRQVEKSDVVLAVIGKGWIDARDSTGARRLDNPDDFVRIEIEAALKQDKRVIPVLMQDAPMPRADELPDGLKPLATRHYVRLTHERFRPDTQILARALREALDEAAAARARDEMARRAQAVREAEQKARQDKEDARRIAMAALSAEQIAKAEELANWDFIKDSTVADDFRDHLARFPDGVCARMARHRLASLTQPAPGSDRTIAATSADAAGAATSEAQRNRSRHEPQPASRLSAGMTVMAAMFALIFAAGLVVTVLSLRTPPSTSHSSPPSLAPGQPKVATTPAPTPSPPLDQPLVVPTPVPATRPPLVVPTPVPATRPPKTVKCPSVSQKAQFEVSLKAGFKSFRRSVTPGGGLDLSDCRSDMTGWVYDGGPDVALQYEPAWKRTIEVNSGVDTVLAIVDPNGVWHFNESRSPRIIFPNAARGRYLIWVGSTNEGWAKWLWHDGKPVAWSEIVIVER